MELAPEDNLRLNVLLSQELQAVRVDASKMEVCALTPKGEASIVLNQTGRGDQYLKIIREFLSSHVLDSPGGYPVYLQRWTRFSHQRDEKTLQNLLLLGEPEAIVAVVHAPGLTPELARRAWWVMPEAENARTMLKNPAVAAADIGREMAQYLIDYLPFETEPRAMLESVRLVLQPGLTTEEEIQSLWKRAQRKGVFYIGFLQARPNALPHTESAHPLANEVNELLAPLLEQDNIVATTLCKALSPQGQVFIKTAEMAMEKVMDQTTTTALFEMIGNYFSPLLKGAGPSCQSADLVDYATAILKALESDPGMAKVLEKIPTHADKIAACLALSQVGKHMLDSFFSRSTTVGPLMRRNLTPWTDPVVKQLQSLQK